MLHKEKEVKQPNVKEGWLNVDSDPYGIFTFAINSQVTKQKYTYKLTKFFDFVVCFSIITIKATDII